MSRFPVAILAGGLSTRLRPLTEHIPKVLIDVAGKPFAVHQLELLCRNGFSRVVFCVGYLGEQVRSVLGDGSACGMKISYVFDGPKLKGTGGALKNALPFLGDAFFVIYGDSYLEIDYGRVQQVFLKSGKMGLMTVFRNADQWDKSNVLFDEGRIVRYDKKNREPEMKHIDYGLGIFKSRVFDNYADGQALDLANIYQDLIARSELAGYEITRRFYEIGSFHGLKETREYLVQKKTCPGIFLDRDGVINRIIMRNGRPASPRTLEEFEWKSGVKDFVRQLNDHDLPVVVVTNQPDIARGKMTRSVLNAMTEMVYSAIPVDSILVCPHDDSNGCDCRKPKPGMLLDAAQIWNIDCERSFMIGDSWKDMQAGRSAGCMTILFDQPYNREVTCDFRVNNFQQAIKLILKISKDQIE